MEYVPLKMVHPNLARTPLYDLPPGYSYRTFRPGDDRLWAAIVTAAGEFRNEQAAVARFRQEFGTNPELLKRCFFLLAPDKQAVGTSMAWYSGSEWGRLHWIAIHPAYQGLGLGKPLVSLAIRYLREHHKQAYLTTQTTSYVGIKIYLDFGFQPHVISTSCIKGWQLVADKLNLPEIMEKLE